MDPVRDHICTVTGSGHESEERSLIGDIYVIDGDLPQVLISDITFTSKGSFLSKTTAP
jgi:hypothetical protein